MQADWLDASAVEIKGLCKAFSTYQSSQVLFFFWELSKISLNQDFLLTLSIFPV